MTAAGKQDGARARAAATAVVGAIVLAVVVMLIVPLPKRLLDLLLTLNLGLSVVLLLGAAWARDALSLATFPTLLVLTTLFRLGLNVSTVRLILLQADAGQVVAAFGRFVVRGDYLVGGAVFLVLTIVQYVVIARGAERVAEVAARFTLDAMPGKQLAIDADLRAGAIDAREAQRRRATLGRESQLYGSLDGAMRFVKGDAVASILILCVSLAGGLLIGVLRRNMTLADAAELYTLLTIGDGLAAQIPALLLSTAAGLLVTRVAPVDDGSEDGSDGGVLGADIARQFLGRPQVLLAVAGLLGVLAILPGLPVVPFGAVALLFAGGAVVLLRRPVVAPAPARRLPAPHPIVEVVADLGDEAAARLRALLVETRDSFVARSGVPLDAFAVRAAAASAAGAFEVRLRGARIGGGALDEREPQAAIAREVARLLGRHAGDLLGLDETQQLLDALGARNPVLVREVIPRRVDLPLLAQVLRRLVAEGVPLGDLRDVLEALAAAPATEKDPTLLVERVRQALGAHRLTARAADPARLAALVLEPLVEEAVREAIRPGVGVLAIEPRLADEIVAAVAGQSLAAGGAPVVVTAADVRRHVRRLLAEELPDLPVLSWQELGAGVAVEPVGRVKVE